MKKKTFAEMEMERDLAEEISKQLPEEEDADDLDRPPKRGTVKQMTFAERDAYEERKELEKGRWICMFCGAKAQYHPPKCPRCDHTDVKWFPKGTVEPFWGIAEGSLGWRAKRLFRLAEQYYFIPFDKLLEDEAKLKEAGLDEVPLTDEVIQQARMYSYELADRISERVERINNFFGHGPKEKPSYNAPTKTPTPSTRGGTRLNIYGFPVTAVIRWMGKNDWTFKDAVKCLTILQIPMAESTVRIQLNAGKSGARGEPAAITPSQGNELRQSLGK